MVLDRFLVDKEAEISLLEMEELVVVKRQMLDHGQDW